MLRIAHHSKTLLKQKEGWWTKDLLKGLLIAFFFHLGLFLIFRIESFFDPNRLPLLSPVSVEVDLSFSSVQKVMQEHIFVYPIESDLLPPSLDFPDFEFAFEKRFLEKTPSEPDFSIVEKIEYYSAFEGKDDRN